MYACTAEDAFSRELTAAERKAIERERRFALVDLLRQEGLSLGQIAKVLNLPREQVKAYSHADVAYVEVVPLRTARRAIREGVI